jgi:fibronectin type 3 domain-containing protein
MYSPLQMAADLPENYEKHLDAFQFIKDVAVNWDQSIYLEAEPGDFLTVARKTKGKDEWFLGAITDENARTANIELNFLTPGKTYKATVYEDGKEAHWEKNPKSYAIKTIQVTSNSKIKLNLTNGGGAAIRFALIN